MGTDRGARLVAAVRARGSDARDTRDAAHEACHALQWGVRRGKKWTRENIHARKPKRRDLGVRDELLARAVEQLVCRALGAECWSVEHAATVCYMETLKNERIKLPGGDWVRDQILAAMESIHAKRMTQQVLDLIRDKEE